MCNGGKSTFSLFTNGTFFMFFSPSTNTSLLGHFLFIQWFCFALLSHKHKKQGYFVLPPCCPRSMDTTFKSPHITHSCSVYLILARIVFIFLYVSFICIECPIGVEASLFPLCNRTHFKFLLKLSMNSLHSDGVQDVPIAVISPSMLSQNNKFPSILKNSMSFFPCSGKN